MFPTRHALWLVIAALVLCAQAPAGEMRRTATTDVDGVAHRPGEAPECPAVVVVFLKPDCEICASYLPQLGKMARSNENKGVEVYGVVSDRTVTRSAAALFRDTHRIPFPVLFDASGEIRRQLAPECAPQAYVLSRFGSALYSGAIDDAWIEPGNKRTQVRKRYLGDALKAAVSGKTPGVPRTDPVGTPYEELPESDPAGAITFDRDIAPLVFCHCTTCHRGGGSAPFALETYQDVSKQAQRIREAVTRRQMPLWKPVRGEGRFAGDRSLADDEIALFTKWIDGGAPEGNPEDLPPPPKFTESWPLGKPDLVLELPLPFDVPADGEDLTMHFVLPFGLKEDRLISAIDIRAGSRRAVRYANVYLDDSGAARLLDAADPAPGYRLQGGPGFVPTGYLGGWMPGAAPRRLPRGMGRMLKKGSDFVLELHYHPTGSVERDRTQVALYFAPRSARQMVGEMFVGNLELTIPAGESSSIHLASYVLPSELTLLEITPHMHLLGREIDVQAETPDRKKLPLIRIRDWDFRWQEHYAYDPPLKLAAGTRISARFVYDNSDGNSRNPNFPPRTVTFGEDATGEMATVLFRVTADTLAPYETLLKDNQEYYDRKLNQLFQRRLQQLSPGWKPATR